MRASRLLSLVAVVALSGCATSKWYDAAVRYRSKNAHASLEYLAMVLKEDPSHEEAKALALEIGRGLADETSSKTEQMTKDGKFEAAVGECDRMLVSAKLISEMPGNMSVFADTDLRARVAEKAATDFYEKGQALEGNDWIKAAVCFRRALGFKKGFKDAQKRYNAAREAAMIRLALPPFQSVNQDGGEFVTSITQTFGAEFKKLDSEFVTIVQPGSESKGTIHGKLIANYQDSGVQQEPKAADFEETVYATDPNTGATLYDPQGQPIVVSVNKYHAEWVVYTRSTSATVEVSFETVMTDGSSSAQGSESASNQASGRWRSRINGDVKAAENDPSGDFSNLPEQAPAIPSPAQLAGGLLADPVKKLAKTLFDHYGRD